MKTMGMSAERNEMVHDQIEARGVRDPLVLDAMRTVPREEFLPERLREFAYDDAPLPIAEEQTISQPYIVAFMIEALALKGGEGVLEIGTGSGYAAAVLGEIAKEVYTVERIKSLADQASSVLKDMNCHNVHVLHGDGTRGWPNEAPFDAIVVAAGGPTIPETLKSQLKIGGRLVIPIGTTRTNQELVRVTRISKTKFTTEDIADVRFVPLIGDEGWQDSVDLKEVSSSKKLPARITQEDPALSKLIANHCEPFDSIETADLEPLLRRIGDARVVLLGEATHGTSEFYEMRSLITRALIERKGFTFVGIEGDWPDVAKIDHYVRHFEYPASEWTAFSRFPTWMWRNREVRSFVDWLRHYNADFEPEHRIAFYGLDLYSLHRSIRQVLEYLRDVDPETAKIAQHRYGCLTPWQSDPAAYGRAALNGTYRSCDVAVGKMLNELRRKHREYTPRDGERYFDAMQNATLVVNAEEYYRVMYYGSRASWNLRDGHMFATLASLLDYHGNHSKAIVWAHNSHVGDASATEMSYRKEINIGQLCRNQYGSKCYSIGFGTNAGTVAAASEWGGPMETKTIVPSLPRSYERLFHESECPNFMLPLRQPHSTELRDKLLVPRLQRAIGVIYRPETERESHYFECCLPRQFDEMIWFDESSAVTPFDTSEVKGMPETYPFGL
ncbi:MAG: protein-L-isoaspartate(D-aspartate) O-methyltransferase [Planctomycetota bacterium]